MEALGILDVFSQPRFGGFGSDFCSGNTEELWRDRAEMIRIAQQKCRGVPQQQLVRSHAPSYTTRSSHLWLTCGLIMLQSPLHLGAYIMR